MRSRALEILASPRGSMIMITQQHKNTIQHRDSQRLAVERSAQRWDCSLSPPLFAPPRGSGARWRPSPTSQPLALGGARLWHCLSRSFAETGRGLDLRSGGAASRALERRRGCTPGAQCRDAALLGGLGLGHCRVKGVASRCAFPHMAGWGGIPGVQHPCLVCIGATLAAG